MFYGTTRFQKHLWMEYETLSSVDAQVFKSIWRNSEHLKWSGRSVESQCRRQLACQWTGFKSLTVKIPGREFSRLGYFYVILFFVRKFMQTFLKSISSLNKWYLLRERCLFFHWCILNNTVINIISFLFYILYFSLFSYFVCNNSWALWLPGFSR